MDMYCPACGSGLVRKGTKTYQTLSDHVTRPNVENLPERATYKCPNGDCYLGLLTGMETDVKDPESGRQINPDSFFGVEGGLYNLDGGVHILLSRVIDTGRLSAVTQPTEHWKGNVARPSVAQTMQKLGWSTDPVELADQEQ